MAGVNVEIKGKETVSTAAAKASDSIKGMGEKSKSVFSGITVTAGDVANAVKAIAAAAADAYVEFAEQERAVLTFNAAMKQAGITSYESVKALRDYAEAQARRTGADDEAILSMQAFLATAGRNETQIKAIISAASDMSIVTGKDLRTSVEEINKTFSGTEGRMGQVVIGLQDLTDEELRNGAAVDVIARQYGGLADELAGSAKTAVDNLANSFDDFKAAVGGSIAPAVNPFLDWVTDIVDGWTKAIAAGNRYKELAAKGFMTPAEQVEKLNMDLDRVRQEKREDLALHGYSADGFNSWLAGQMAAGNPKYVYPAGSTPAGIAAIRSGWQKDWFAEVDAYKSGGAQAEYQAQITELTAKIAALTAEINATDLTAEINATTPPAESPAAPTVTATGDRMFAGFPSAPDLPAWMFPTAGYGTPGDSFAAPGDDSATGGIFAGILDSVDKALVKYVEGKGEAGAAGTTSRDVGGFDLGIGAPWMATLGPIFESVASLFGDLVGPLASVKALMDPLGTILGATMEVIGPLVNEALAPLVGILKIVGNALGQILAPVIIAIGKVISWVAEGLIWVWNGIVKAINWALGWLGVHLSEASLSSVTAAGTTTTTSGAVSTSGGAAAQYSRPRDINVYVNVNTSALVGNDGVAQFALIIGRELKSAGVLGLA